MIYKKKLSALGSSITKPVDLFISFCGFEKRCLSVIKNLTTDKIKESIVFINKNAPQESRNNLHIIKEYLGAESQICSICLFDPIDLADSMITTLSKTCAQMKNPEILVDITCFTHEALLIFIAIARQYFCDAKIKYIYTVASEYASESKESTEKWLSRGINEVRSVLGFAGDVTPTRDSVLILMVGYECERALQVIDNISPEELIITYNDSKGATDQNNADASSTHAFLLKELAVYYQDPQFCIIPSNDPFKTASELDNIIETIDKDKNIIIAPMNNKLSTVGAALVALKRPEIQLCYAPATYYNTSSYSVEGDTCYIFSLDDCYSYNN